MYFFLLVIFLCLIVGPIVAGKKLKLDLPDLPMEILQPTGFNNNDTKATPTGVCVRGTCPKWDGEEDTSSDAATTGEASRRFRRYMAY